MAKKRKKGGGGGKRRRDRRHKLFHRAYNKAAAIEPGGANTLTEAEEAELLRYLYPKPIGTVPCQICQRPTQDKDRKKLNRPGLRVCGPCLYNKPPEWGRDAVL